MAYLASVYAKIPSYSCQKPKEGLREATEFWLAPVVESACSVYAVDCPATLAWLYSPECLRGDTNKGNVGGQLIQGFVSEIRRGTYAGKEVIIEEL